LELSVIQKISVFALPVLFAITLHEAAHGYVARHFGDLTAFAAGRISLNPLRHIDLVGTIIVPLIFLALSKVGGPAILFGWAKPVPVNFANLRQPKKDMFWVAAAGPLSNLAMAIGWGAGIKLGVVMPETYFSQPLILMGAAGVFFNIVLMVLNLLPLPPLDGGRIAVSLLPHGLAWKFAQVERYGFIILIALLITGLLGAIIGPVIFLIIMLIELCFGLPLGAINQVMEMM